MHPEIEKLIDLALADGQITEKERNVILKKASELGVDADEVELILDGRLHQLDASKPKQKEKVGNIKTCPACGGSVNSFDFKCFSCGHEFSNVKIIGVLEKFELGLNEVQNINLRIQRLNLENDISYEQRKAKEKSKLKAEYVKNYKVPLDKESIVSFLFHTIPNFSGVSQESILAMGEDSESMLRQAYRGKAIELINIAKLMFKDDTAFLKQISEIEKNVVKTQKTEKAGLKVFWIVILICILFAAIGVPLMLKNAHTKQETEDAQFHNEQQIIIQKLDEIEKNINLNIEKNDLAKARYFSNQLVWTWKLNFYENQKLEEVYEQKKSRYLNSISELEKQQNSIK
jgi:hypothetical protein